MLFRKKSEFLILFFILSESMAVCNRKMCPPKAGGAADGALRCLPAGAAEAVRMHRKAVLHGCGGKLPSAAELPAATWAAVQEKARARDARRGPFAASRAAPASEAPFFRISGFRQIHECIFDGFRPGGVRRRVVVGKP